MKNKRNLLLIFSIAFTAISCNPFSQAVTAGVVKTVNGGADWQYANTVTTPANTNLSGSNMAKIDLEPGHREVVFAASYNTGLYKSDDSGSNWKRILSKIGAYDFVINPNDTHMLYVAGYYDNHGRLLVTKDSGVTWQEVYNEETAENAVRAVAINPVQPSQLVIGTTKGSLVKSVDGGLSWSLVKNFDDQINRIIWQNGTIYILLKTKGLTKTSDLGLTFQDMTTPLTAATGAFGEAKIANFSQVFIDSVSAQLMYLTTDRGLYKSVDGGVNWAHLTLPAAQGSSAARAIAVAKSSSNVVYTSVGGTIYKTTDGGNTWQTQNIGTGFINTIAVDPDLPQIAYAGIYGSNQ